MAYPPAPQYPQQPSQEGPRTRPAVVTAVVWTQFATAAVLIASAVASLMSVDAMVEATMRAMESDPSIADSGADISGFDGFIRAGAYVGVAAYVIFAVFYVVLGLLNGRGNRPARVLSWVLSGLSFLCCGLGQLIGLGMQGLTAGAGSEEYNDEMMRAIEEATPVWAAVLNWVALFMFIVGSLVVVILLATPAANEFFRKEEAPMGPYMGQPPYGQPGQAPYGAQPGQAQPDQPGQPGQAPQAQPAQPQEARPDQPQQDQAPGSEEPPQGQQPPAPPQQ